MPSVTSSFADLIGSILSAIGSAVSVIFGLFQHFFNAIFAIIQSLFTALRTSIVGAVQTAEGLFKFLLSNLLVIGLVLAALFLYGVYQQRGGKSFTAKRKTALVWRKS